MKDCKIPYSVSHGAALLVALVLSAGCSSQRDGRISIAEDPLTVTADTAGAVRTDVTFRVPRSAFSTRSRLIIVPEVVYDDARVQALDPLVMDAPIYGKKRVRREVLEDYVDPYARVARRVELEREMTFPYTLCARLERGHSARVRAVVTEDGCGACTGLDTVDVARLVSPKKKVVKVLRPRRKVRTKVEHGQGVARLEFVMNMHDIRPDMGDNRAELARMAADLGPVLKDTSATILGIEICGVASVDGPLGFNTKLSLDRAREARAWLCANLGLCEDMSRLISVSSRPEGWGPVVEAMERDGHKDAAKVREIAEKYKDEPDDVAERVIRKMACWPDIRDRYLQRDRKVTYSYSFSHAGVTEEYDDMDDMEEIEMEVEP